MPGLRAAYRAFWEERGVQMPDYQDTVQSVPHVCLKVPTAGGKTYIAINALQTIFHALAQFNPDRARFVVWLVPSTSILHQTYKALNDKDHPYRQRLNTHFSGRVEIFDKQNLLGAAGFTPDSVREALSIIVVLSYDSLRARNKEDRKIYQENGQLAGFSELCYSPLENIDPSALINVIRALNPVVVVDESHNATSELSVDMLKNLNPAFILDLTATPREKSNIISYVDAMALKKYHMVKLPVIVYNHADKTSVIANAIDLQKRLESEAIQEEQEGGAYIRPIVLFQAQARTNEEATTFLQIREKLVAAGIPAEQIKIKTAALDELKNLDLMSRDCSVRYIITVNALKEGWDCPFAYVLASLADKSSAVDVEQILGRILRQPYVIKHSREPLNHSYVMTASGRFLDTLQNIVKGLNRAGFSARDYRDETHLQSEITPSNDGKPGNESSEQTNINLSQSGDKSATDETGNTATNQASASNQNIPHNDTANPDEIDVSRIATAIGENARNPIIEKLVSSEPSEKTAPHTDETLPLELESRMKKHAMKACYMEDAKTLRLPQFYLEAGGGWFADENCVVRLAKENLLEGFRLSRCETNISFEDSGENLYQVDMEKIGNDDYKPEFKKVSDPRAKERIMAYILSLPNEGQIRQLTGRFTKLLGAMDPITDQEISGYIRRIFEGMSAEQIRHCLEREQFHLLTIKRKIQNLAARHAMEVFGKWMEVGKLHLKPLYGLPEIINPVQTVQGITKSLYGQESVLNQFEMRLINDVANLPNVVWWHKNIEKRGFCINGFINHYPDFLVRLESGRLVILEGKGDDRDNSDSAAKLRLGKSWAAKAGETFRFLMVFDNNKIEGAYTLLEALELIRQM